MSEPDLIQVLHTQELGRKAIDYRWRVRPHLFRTPTEMQ